MTSKYTEIWKRAHIRILTSIRISRLMKNIKLYGPKSFIDLTSPEIHQLIQNNKPVPSTIRQTKNPDLILSKIFHPTKGFKIYWNFLLGCCLIYTATITPFLLAFVQDREFDQWFGMDCMMTTIFILDIFITLNTACYNEQGKLEFKRMIIFKQYLKSWLVIDIIACFPYDIIQFSMNPNSQRVSYNTLSKLARLKSLPRLFRLSKVLVLFNDHKAFSFLESIYYAFHLSHTGVRLFSTVLMIAISIHITACLWYFTARLYDFDYDTWVYRHNYLDYNIFDRYLVSLYWTLTTLCTVGYGDIIPNTNGEVILAMLWMIVAIYFLSFAISSLSSMISSSESNRKSLLNKKLELIKQFSLENVLPKDLQFRLQKHIKEISDRTLYTITDKQGILNDLSHPLKLEISFCIHQGAIRFFPFLLNHDNRFVYTIVPLMQIVCFEKEEAFFNEGEDAKEIFFFIKGKAFFETIDKVRFRILRPGSYFGDVETLIGAKRYFTVRAAEGCTLWSMGIEAINIIEREFPLAYKELYMSVIAREKRIFMDLAEMKAISKAKSLSEIKRLVAEEYEIMASKRHIQNLESGSLSKIEAIFEYTKLITEKSADKIKLIENMLK